MTYLRIVAATLLPLLSSHAITISYDESGIADDTVASNKRLNLTSVTDIITDIKSGRHGALDKITELSLDRNNIGLHGAAQLLKFASENLPKLEELSLRFNRIYERPDDSSYAEFKTNLAELVKKDTVRCVNISGNAVGCLPWVSSFLSEFGIMYPDKVIWR